jgi:hypothetical protein
MATIDEYLDGVPAPLRPVGDQLRALLDAGLARATGQVWHGHPVWMVGKTPVAGFKAYSSYVTLMIWPGARVDDPSGRLEVGSRDMASVKLRSADEIDPELFAGWFKQADALGPA